MNRTSVKFPNSTLRNVHLYRNIFRVAVKNSFPLLLCVSVSLRMVNIRRLVAYIEIDESVEEKPLYGDYQGSESQSLDGKEDNDVTLLRI